MKLAVCAVLSAAAVTTLARGQDPATSTHSSAASPARAAQPLDEEYTRQILEHTTDDFFVTPYVDHLPAAEGIPTPLDVLEHIAGAADVLSYSHEVMAFSSVSTRACKRLWRSCLVVIGGGRSSRIRLCPRAIRCGTRRTNRWLSRSGERL